MYRQLIVSKNNHCIHIGFTYVNIYVQSKQICICSMWFRISFNLPQVYKQSNQFYAVKHVLDADTVLMLHYYIVLLFNVWHHILRGQYFDIKIMNSYVALVVYNFVWKLDSCFNVIYANDYCENQIITIKRVKIQQKL